MLGIVSNAGYDLIKTWLLSSRKRREAQQRVIAIFEYQVIVELVVKYFQEYPDVETTIRTSQELHEISFSEVKERITGDLESEPDAPDTSTRTR
jgi:predicted methyltransferase